jgi:hypothetical protein
MANVITNITLQATDKVDIMLSLNAGLTEYFDVLRPDLNPNYQGELIVYC